MIRSLLYVPAHSDRFVAKARERGADAIILDLEDGVPPAEKDAARANLKSAVPAVARNGAIVFVRVNAGDDRRDKDCEAACRAGAFGVMVPKVRNPETLMEIAARLEPVERELKREPLRVIPMIEDAGAVLDARAIALGPRVFALLVGGEDLATEMGADPRSETLRTAKMMVHFAAKSAGVQSYGLMNSIADYGDLPAVAAAAKEARALGFDGASCVHPASVPILNEAFAPSAAELDRAKRLVAAFDEAAKRGLGAFSFEGEMVDLPIYERARRLIAQARKP